MGLGDTPVQDGLPVLLKHAVGCLQEWNRKNPDKALKVNDTILEVNGEKAGLYN